MTVIRLSAPADAAPGRWRASELRELEAIFAAFVREGDAAEYALAATERGDPQFYLLMPGPDCECILSVSRIGRGYVVEDGAGVVIAEVSDLRKLADECSHMVGRRHGLMVAKGVAAWLAVRSSVEEKIEAMMGEPVEVITHIAPQLVALV
jgi:hypothetical protein